MSERFKKMLAWTLLLAMTNEMLLPTVAFALTDGPKQPESSGFQPIETTEMVDVQSGDFKYNLPLFEIDGYPVNLTYNSGVTMDQEASWVGLGWNLTPGAVNRTVKGIPDDFSGELIREERRSLENKTFQIGVGALYEIAGIKIKKLAEGNDTILDKISIPTEASIYYNTYDGFGFNIGAGVSKKFGSLQTKLNVGFDSQKGLDVDPYLGMAFKASEKLKVEELEFFAGLGTGFNTRSGLKRLSFSSGASYQVTVKDKDGKVGTIGSAPSGPGGSLPMGTTSYMPSSGQLFDTEGANFKVSFGGEFLGAHGGGSVSGSYSKQEVYEPVKNVRAFGYIYTDSSTAAEDLKDINREKDGSINKSIKNLPVASATYDIFSVSGQGAGGAFRAYRNDMGTFSDPRGLLTGSSNVNIGAELGVGNAARYGGDFNVVSTNNYHGIWDSGHGNNAHIAATSFRKGEVGNIREPFYFKQIGEITVIDSAFFQGIGGTSPMSVPVYAGGNADPHLKIGSSVVSIPTARTYDNSRAPRTQMFYFLSAKEADTWGVTRTRNSYPAGYFTTFTGLYSIARNSSAADTIKAHFIGEIHNIQQDGRKYVYGLPAMNILQKDVTFNASGRAVDKSLGTVDYVLGESGNDNSAANSRGIDHYYSATTVPAHAHTFLMTAVLSPDYTDVSNDGLTDDDLGTFTKFNYTMTSNNYKWRAPYGELTARHNPGLLVDDTDDKGSYAYGIKELWYVHSIETKNYIAEFYISQRSDALGAADENGGLPGSIAATDRSFKLDSIVLFNKTDRIVNKQHATPVKIIDFHYDYSLCKGVENFAVISNEPHANHESGYSTGKLTLKKVIIMSGRSKRGSLSPYLFSYATENPDYNPGRYDRWGNYKVASGGLNNGDFPYVTQFDSSLAAQWASAWNLTDITLPSGGKIQITYEADDYAFVQDHKAASMFVVKGIGNSTAFHPGYTLYDGNKKNNYLYVQLHQSGLSSQQFREQYLIGLDKIYFSFMLRMASEKNGNRGSERITGYVPIDVEGSGVCSNGTHGYILLKQIKVEGAANLELNPITYSSFNFAHNNLSKFIQAGANPNSSDIKNVLLSIVGLFEDITKLFLNPYRLLIARSLGKEATLSQSWVRLHHPTLKKYGGGARVKRIVMTDDWKEMRSNASGAVDATYGQEYSYAYHDPYHGLISSGVAVYEPFIGGDENPLRKPVPYLTPKEYGRPRGEYFHETPFGEMFYPAAAVGYAHVKVTNIHADKARSALGYTVHEFYTARDFPVVVTFNELEPKEGRSRSGFGKRHSFERMTASQGYAIELNDMHGKVKSVKQYGKSTSGDDELISGTVYHYHHNGAGRLNNEVNIIRFGKTGTNVGKAILGVDVDVVVDARRQEDLTVTDHVPINLDFAFLGPIPLFIATNFPKLTSHERSSRTLVITKVIQRAGILEKVEEFDFAAKVTSENLIFDPYTGEVVVKRIENHFRDKQYEVNMPAYWVYGFAGHAFLNTGYIDNLTFDGTDADVDFGIYQKGDVLIMENEGRVWVYDVGFVQVGCNIFERIKVVKADGSLVRDVTDKVKILHSGRLNLLNQTAYTLASADQNFSTAAANWLTSSKILDARFTESKLEKNADAFSYTIPATYGGISAASQRDRMRNPFLFGELGGGNLSGSRNYMDRRNYTSHVRMDGYYDDFESPFEYDPLAIDCDLPPIPRLTNFEVSSNIDDSKWRVGLEVTKTDIHGNVVETKDALGNYNAAIYGYQGNHLIASSNNARHRNIAYDGFEDYHLPFYKGKFPQHSLNFVQLFRKYNAHSAGDYMRIRRDTTNYALDSTIAHTGRYSLKVNAGQNVTVNFTIPDDSLGTSSIAHTLKSSLDELVTPYIPYDATEKKYVVSGWMKEGSAGTYKAGSASGKFKFYNGVSVAEIQASGPRVDGWQRFEAVVTVGVNKTGTYLILEAGETVNTYFDDIRIYPHQGMMKSYVYDPFSLRLMAILDENNYATFYEYNEEGELIRTKRETEKGVMTIQEGQKLLRKQ